MNLVVLVASFFIMLFLGIPIAFALCLSSLLYMILYSSVPLIIIGQQMLKGGFLYIARNSIFHHRRKPDDEWRYFQANRKLRKTAGGLDAWWSCGC